MMWNAYWVYVRMELKRALRVIPYFLAGATVLILLLGAVALSAGRLIYQDAAVGRITIGMILPEDDLVAKRVIGMLESLDSVGTACDFVYVDRETGEAGLKSGEFCCLMDVPSGFVQDIMNGANTPVTIIFPKNAGVEAALLKELTDSASKTLGVSQAGIYAADELCAVTGHTESIAQTEADLNRIYLKYSASREGYFGKQEVSASGDVTMAEYYGISGFVAVLLLLGIPAAEFMAPHSRVFDQKLRMMGIGRLRQTAARYLAIVLLLALPAAAASAAVAAEAAEFSVYGASAVALSCLTAAAMILLVYELAGSPAAGVMVLFFGTVVMTFMAGGLVPSVFLPAAVKDAGQWMPVKMMMDALTGAFAAPVPGARIKLCAVSAGCFLLAAAVGRKHE